MSKQEIIARCVNKLGLTGHHWVYAAVEEAILEATKTPKQVKSSGDLEEIRTFIARLHEDDIPYEMQMRFLRTLAALE